MSTRQTSLNIHTVPSGFYEGFNPVVSMSAKLIMALLVLWLMAFPNTAGALLEHLKHTTLSIFGTWYEWLLAATFLLCIGILVHPASKRIKLGGDYDIPEHSTLSWLSMMFCAGIGAGILAFSVSEPISHLTENPDLLAGTVTAGSEDSAASALRFAFLHWGFSAWACYALVGVALGLSCHRDGHPLTMRSALEPLLGRWLEGPLGHGIDVISILAISSGIITTIVLGLEQICAGLFILTGHPFFADKAGNAPFAALMTALVVSTSIAIGSVVSGVNRGVKWTSNTGVFLAFGLLAIFVVMGSGSFVAGAFVDGVGAYLRALPAEMLGIHTTGQNAEPQADWRGQWTFFYWAWWIAFAPFVGLFLARISRGRSLREFVLGAVIAPALMCFLWFAITGGSAIMLELDGTADGRIIAAPHAFRIYETIDLLLPSMAAPGMKAVILLMFLVLIVSSTSAAIIALKSIGAGGGVLAETPLHSLLWAVVLAAMTGSIMAVGGVQSIRDVMIVGAVPFSFVMLLMLLAVCKTLFRSSVSGVVRTEPLP